MERLFELLTEISIDPLKQAAFLRDPALVAQDAGLTPEECDLLVRRAGAERDRAIARGPFARCTFITDPGPDPLPDPDPPA
jgi:hypothetical protein